MGSSHYIELTTTSKIGEQIVEDRAVRTLALQSELDSERARARVSGRSRLHRMRGGRYDSGALLSQSAKCRAHHRRGCGIWTGYPAMPVQLRLEYIGRAQKGVDH